MLLQNSVEAPRRHPGALIVRPRPENDFHVESASWSDIARLMRGQDVVVNEAGKVTRFEESTTIHDAHQLALKAISGASLLEVGFINHICSPRALVLNSIALPALREAIADRLSAGVPIPQEAFLVGLLQFVPEEARAAFYAAHPETSSVEESIQRSARAVAVRSDDAADLSAYDDVLHGCEAIATLAHLVKSHQLMVAHLCTPVDAAKIRRSGYAMNAVFGVQRSALAFDRIVNRGEVLERIGR